MNDLQQIHKDLNHDRIKNAMAKIEENVRLSIHHYSVELDIPAQELHEAWAKYSCEKRQN